MTALNKESILHLVKDDTLIYMPSDRVVLKPHRLWDGRSTSLPLTGAGSIPYASEICPGIGEIEFHNISHWFDDRKLLRTGFAIQVFDEYNKNIPLYFKKQAHLFTPTTMHDEFEFADSTNTLVQDIAAQDDVFVCRFSFAQGGKYRVATSSRGFRLSTKVERYSDMVVAECLTEPYKGAFLAFHTSFMPDGKEAVLSQQSFTCQFAGQVEGTGYLVLSIDDNRDRLMERMRYRIGVPESMFEDVKTEWEDYYEEEVPQFVTDDERKQKVMAWTAYYIKSSLISSNKQGPVTPSTVGCGKGSFTGCPVENTQYHILGELHLRTPKIALDEIKSRDSSSDCYGHESCYGNITVPGDRAHDLFNAYVHRQVYKRTGDRELMQKALLSIEESIRLVSAIHDKGDGLFWTGSHLETPMGFDNSSRWDKPFGLGVPFQWPEKLELGVKAVEASCFMVDALNTAAYFREEIGDHEQAMRHKKSAEEIGDNIRRKHWSDEYKFFVDLVGPDDQESDIITLAGTAPLWAGIATREQAEWVAKAIDDPRKFRAKYGPTTHSKDHPLFLDYWRGDVALRMSWLAYIGLRRYGYDSIASWILESTLQRFEDHAYDGAEMWNPESGIGYWTQSAEMGLLIDMIIKNNE